MEDLERLVADVLAADDTEAALDAACAAQPDAAAALRRAIDSLRRFHMLDDAARRGVPEVLGGYRLVELLGRGGMGVVYRACDERSGREVALKVLRPEFLHFAESRERFRREVDAAARLEHAGIVAVHGAGEDGGTPFFTMELVEGSSLAATIAGLRGRPHATLRGSDLCPTRGGSRAASGLANSWVDACLQVARMIAEALTHAHERGVHHRDVKPSNVLVDVHGRARLLDFGLARLDDAQQLTRSQAMLGSLPYMSKEQVEGRCEEYGPRQEVYSLGATLYEMLTLQPAFLGATPEDTRRRVIAADPTPPRRINPAIGRDVQTVCLTALDPDPDRRHPTARAFADELDALLRRRPVRSRPIGPVLRAWRAARRRPTVAVSVALGASLVLAVGVAAVGALHARDVERRAREALVDSTLRFVFDFVQGLRRIPGNTEVRAELLARATEELAAFEADRSLDARRLAAIGEAQLALASALGDARSSNLGERELARERYEHVAGELAPRLAAVDPGQGALLLGRASLGLATIDRVAGAHEQAIATLRFAADALAPQVPEQPVDDDELRMERIHLSLCSELAAVAGSLGRHAEALAGFEAVRDVLARRAAARPADAEAARKLAQASSNVARALYGLGEFDRAADEYASYVTLLERRLAAAPHDATRQFERLRGAVSFPEMLIKAGRLEDAIAECRTTLALCERMIAADAGDATLPDLRMHLAYGLGWAFQERAEAALRGDLDAAPAAVEADLREARVAFVSAREIAAELRAAGRLAAHVQPGRIDERLAAVEVLLADF